MSLFKLFRATTTDDGLSQSEREAIADLLHYCMYADNHLALTEDKVIDDAVLSMNWDPRVAFESYEARSLARVREAKENAEARTAFYQSIQDRLKSKASRDRARSLSARLFQSDGMTDKEVLLFSEIKRLLS
jgi:hypothetical protein